MHNYILLLGTMLVLLACLSVSWTTVTNEINIGDSSISDETHIGLWNRCWSADLNKGELDIVSRCKSIVDMPELDKNDVNLVRILSIISIILGVIAVIEGSISRIPPVVVVVFAALSTLFAIATMVYFVVKIQGKISNSSLGVTFYIQILGTILLAVGTIVHTNPDLLHV